MKHIKGLDTIRAIAILVVIFEHWWIPVDIDPKGDVYHWIKGLVPDGGFGVDLFFVLSGFLITSILLNSLDKNKNEKFRIMKNFIIRRILRIFPIYFLTIIILILIGYPFVKDSLFWISLYISNFLVYKTQGWFNFSHSWSLSVEEQFYLIWPWFIVFVRGKYLKYVFIFAILIGVFSAIYTMKIQQNWAGFVLMPTCMQAFGIGGFYAFLYKTGKLDAFVKFISIAFPIALFFHFYWAFFPDRGRNFTFCFLAINSIISIWMIHKAIYNRSEWIRKYFLENRVLNKIGQISYGIYLYHLVLSFVYEKLIRIFFEQNSPMETTLLDWKNSYFIKLFLLFILSLSSYHFIESPILKLKGYFKYNTEK